MTRFPARLRMRPAAAFATWSSASCSSVRSSPGGTSSSTRASSTATRTRLMSVVSPCTIWRPSRTSTKTSRQLPWAAAMAAEVAR